MLTSTSELLHTARRNGYAIGAFNVYNIEGIQAVVNAATQLCSPVMLQVNPSALKYGKSPLVALCLEAAKTATVPIAVHLDHSTSAKDIHAALASNITSIMADGSHLPYSENLTFTRQITQFAHHVGAVVEAEIGRITSAEDSLSIVEKQAKMTDPLQAAEFVKETRVDALAVTIGNVHGKYIHPPNLDFKRLANISKLVDVPLVLHGADNFPATMISQSINLGVCKFNVNTEIRQAYLDVLKAESSLSSPDLLDLMQKAIASMQSVILEKLQTFGSVGKSYLHPSPYAEMVKNKISHISHPSSSETNSSTQSNFSVFVPCFG